MNSQQNTTQEVLCEFFEIIIHNILHARKLYPETIFELRKKYGIPVYQCIYPELKEYITDCLKAIKFFITKRQLQKIFICFEVENEILERYTCDILEIGGIVESDSFMVELEQSLRNCILKLNSSQSYLNQLPDNSTFSIRLQTTTYSQVEFNQEPSHEIFPWIQVKEIENKVISGDILPLYTIDTQLFNVQFYMEKET